MTTLPARYRYRLPGQQKDVEGAGYAADRETAGFVFSRFGHHGLTTITPSSEGMPAAQTSYDMPTASTSREEHASGVKAIASALTDLSQKTVLSTVIAGRTEVTPDGLFERLCEEYPDAFVFLFSAGDSGTWVGASPERVVSLHGGILTTEALAGTMPADATDEWDEKNIREHTAVSSYIASTLSAMGLSPRQGEMQEKQAGPVKHLCTPFSAEATSALSADYVVRTMAPTPALCGYPYDTAMYLIGRHERHDRGYYGGCVGVISDADCYDIFVNLRSVCFGPDGRYCVYAGGGINLLSDADTEWDETRRKASTILNLL